MNSPPLLSATVVLNFVALPGSPTLWVARRRSPSGSSAQYRLGAHGRAPASNISWNDAIASCRSLSELGQARKAVAR
jgi:hypothetical protein